MRSARHQRPVAGSPYSQATALCLVKNRSGQRSAGFSAVAAAAGGRGATAEEEDDEEEDGEEDDDEEEEDGWHDGDA